MPQLIKANLKPEEVEKLNEHIKSLSDLPTKDNQMCDTHLPIATLHNQEVLMTKLEDIERQIHHLTTRLT